MDEEFRLKEIKRIQKKLEESPLITSEDVDRYYKLEDILFKLEDANNPNRVVI